MEIMNELNVEQVQSEASELIKRQPQVAAIEAQEQAEQVAGYMADVRAYRKRVEDFFRPDIDAACALHKSLLAKMKEVDAAPAKAESECRRLLGDWTERERKRVADEQAALDAAERARVAREANRDGDTRKAKAVESWRIAVVSPVLAAPVHRIEGMSTRDVYRAKVVDLMRLVAAVARGQESITYLQPDMVRLNAVARATRGSIQIAGVAIRKDVSVSQRMA